MQGTSYLTAVATVALYLASPSAISGPLVTVRPGDCIPASRQQKNWLGSVWVPFQPFVKSCEVKSGRKTVLYLISVWADDYEAKLPESAPSVKFPKPILLGPAGVVLGELPMNFPRDPPRTLTVTFARWLGGFPHEVRFWVDDPTVLGNHSIPSLEWDAGSRIFRRSRRKE